MGAMKVWDGSAWQLVAASGAPGATVFVGPDPPTGTQATGNMWYDTDDNTLVSAVSELPALSQGACLAGVLGAEGALEASVAPALPRFAQRVEDCREATAR